MSTHIKIEATLPDGTRITVELPAGSNPNSHELVMKRAVQLLEDAIAAVRREGKQPEHRCGEKPSLRGQSLQERWLARRGCFSKT